MGKEEDSLLMFLSMEKRQDLESGSDKKPEQAEEYGGEGVVSSCPGFWICVAATLFALSLVSGALQFGILVRYPRHTYHVVKHANFVPVYEVPLRNGELFREPFSGPARDEYQGEAVVHDGRAYLTSQHSADEGGVIARPNSVGRLVHSQVLQMKHRGSETEQETVASFYVTFVFSIENSPFAAREASGDGFAFFMVPEGNAIGSAGGSLGVVDDMNNGNALHTFAVEFDTRKNPSLHDINNNHVGINLNSMVSVVSQEAGYWSSKGNERRAHEFRPVDLTSGKIQAWIDYDGMSQELTVRISPFPGRKPYKPLLRTNLDLSNVLNEYMSVGFSAATGDVAAKHIIHSWQFEESTTQQHWRTVAGNAHSEVAVMSVDSDLPRKAMFFPASGLPRDHVSNLPAFRNAHRHRQADRTSAGVIDTASVLPESDEVEIVPKSGMRKYCAGYLSGIPTMDFATFKEHFVLNSLWVFLGLGSVLLFIHLVFIAYHIVIGCYDTYLEYSEEPLGMEYCKVFEHSEEDEARYVLVVSDSEQHLQPQSENRPLDRI